MTQPQRNELNQQPVASGLPPLDAWSYSTFQTQPLPSTFNGSFWLPWVMYMKFTIIYNLSYMKLIKS